MTKLSKATLLAFLVAAGLVQALGCILPEPEGRRREERRDPRHEEHRDEHHEEHRDEGPR